MSLIGQVCMEGGGTACREPIWTTAALTFERFDEALLLESPEGGVQRPRTEHDLREGFDVLR